MQLRELLIAKAVRHARQILTDRAVRSNSPYPSPKLVREMRRIPNERFK